MDSGRLSRCTRLMMNWAAWRILSINSCRALIPPSVKLTQLTDGGINALQELIESIRQAAQFIMRRVHRERRPESIPISNPFCHQSRMLRERRDGFEALSHIKCGDHRGQQ